MPWSEADNQTVIGLIDQPGTYFILFYASGEPPWCPDCIDATPALKAVFNADDAPTLNVVRVGNKEEWKAPENTWKLSPYHAQEIPLLVKLIDGKEVNRLGEEDCKDERKLKRIL